MIHGVKTFTIQINKKAFLCVPIFFGCHIGEKYLQSLLKLTHGDTALFVSIQELEGRLYLFRSDHNAPCTAYSISGEHIYPSVWIVYCTFCVPSYFRVVHRDGRSRGRGHLWLAAIGSHGPSFHTIDTLIGVYIIVSPIIFCTGSITVYSRGHKTRLSSVSLSRRFRSALSSLRPLSVWPAADNTHPDTA